MPNFVPIEKMSKKARKELAKAQRVTWGALNPVTRRPDDPKKYNRRKSRREESFFDDGIFLRLHLSRLWGRMELFANAG